jgi:membrane-bound ClpP family serine protease
MIQIAGESSPAVTSVGAKMRRNHSLHFVPRALFAARSLLCFLFASLVSLLPSTASAADRPTEGVIIQIPTVITSESTDRLRSLLFGPLKNFEAGAANQGGRFVVVCDFNPEGQRASCDQLGVSYDLARYLRSLSRDNKGVTTVAYVHGDVKRHSVLPVLACSEIVFSERGRLGEVATAARPLTDVERTAYEEINRNRHPPALVRKMYDPNFEVIRSGDRYAASDEKPRPNGQIVPELSDREVVLYNFALARKVGLCQQLPFASLEEVRDVYGLPRQGLHRTLERAVCWRIPVEGAITGELVEQTRRRIQRAIRARVNLLIIELKCAGGDASQAYELGQYLASLNDRRSDNPVETIAYVTNKAHNLATFLAFGCSKIVMQLEEAEDEKEAEDDEGLPREARLGGFSLYLQRPPSLEPIYNELADLGRKVSDAERQQNFQRAAQLREEVKVKEEELKTRLPVARAELANSLSKMLTDLAGRQLYPTLLAAGMLDAKLRIDRVERAVGASGQAFLSEEDFNADQNGPRQWRKIQLVKPWLGQTKYEGKLLTLTARQARDVGIAAAVVKDFTELCKLEGVTPSRVQEPGAEWLDGLGDFLRHPWTSVVLVMVGIVCLMLELKMPGVGLPGVIAAVCFVLFFWAHSQLNGQITWLALLLFMLGLVLIALEVFVLPGFGVCGIAGTVLVLGSLGLVAYGHWPRSSEEWAGFGQKLMPFSASLVGSMVLVVIIARYLPHIPILNRLMHRPTEDGEDPDGQSELPLHAELQSLLGAIGIAATPLRPAGKTQFGDSFVDVVAEGGYIMPGTRVQVIEVEGNRVVVKEV